LKNRLSSELIATQESPGNGAFFGMLYDGQQKTRRNGFFSGFLVLSSFLSIFCFYVSYNVMNRAFDSVQDSMGFFYQPCFFYFRHDFLRLVLTNYLLMGH
jgi:hypothetical protein